MRLSTRQSSPTASGPGWGGAYELGLRNALPDREVVTVLSQIAVSADTVDLDGLLQSTSLEPHAIVELRSLRTLLGAGALVIHAVRLGWGFDYESALGSASPAELRRHGFAPDSMGPKVEAACRFVEATGHRAAIGALTDAVQIVRGAAGTQIAPPRA